MVSLTAAKQLALALPEAEEKSPFEKPDFRIKNKVFAVLHEDKSSMVVKLSVIDQSVFCVFDKAIIYPVAGVRGRLGWTTIKESKQIHVVGCITAWKTVAPSKLVAKYFPQR